MGSRKMMTSVRAEFQIFETDLRADGMPALGLPGDFGASVTFPNKAISILRACGGGPYPWVDIAMRCNVTSANEG